MTRLRAAHNYHEAKTPSLETYCSKCGKATPHLCEWCGACNPCHKGATPEKSY